MVADGTRLTIRGLTFGQQPARYAGQMVGRSQAAQAAWLLPPAARDAVLRERGDQLMRARYAPLRSAP